jgi:CBS domain-containing protein
MTPGQAGAGTVSDAMHPGVVSCRPETTLAEVAGLMAEHAVHCVVVDGIVRDAAGGDHLVWAVASDLDVARAVSAGPGADAVTAGALARTDPVSVAPEDSVGDAAGLMARHGVTHLVVVPESTGTPVGVISTLDVARAVAEGGA